MNKFSAGLATWRLFQVYDTRLKTVVRAIDGAGIGCTCPCGISIDGKFWGSKGNRCGEGSLVRWDEREGEKARQQNPRPANKQGRKARRAFHLVDFCFLPAALPTARFPPGRNHGQQPRVSPCGFLFPALCPAHCPVSPGQKRRAALHKWGFMHS